LKQDLFQNPILVVGFGLELSGLMVERGFVMRRKKIAPLVLLGVSIEVKYLLVNLFFIVVTMSPALILIIYFLALTEIMLLTLVVKAVFIFPSVKNITMQNSIARKSQSSDNRMLKEYQCQPWLKLLEYVAKQFFVPSISQVGHI